MTKRQSHASALLLAVFLAVIAGFFGCAGPIKFERLGTLLELKKEDGLLSESLKQEAKNFEAVREALRAGTVKVGDTKEVVIANVGRPVIVYSEKDGEKWMYKETGSSWFKGSKIYLFFSLAGELSDYQCLRVDCPT